MFDLLRTERIGDEVQIDGVQIKEMPLTPTDQIITPRSEAIKQYIKIAGQFSGSGGIYKLVNVEVNTNVVTADIVPPLKLTDTAGIANLTSMESKLITTIPTLRLNPTTPK